MRIAPPIPGSAGRPAVEFHGQPKVRVSASSKLAEASARSRTVSSTLVRGGTRTGCRAVASLADR